MRGILGPESDCLDTTTCPFRGPYPRGGGARYWWKTKEALVAAMAGRHILSSVFSRDRFWLRRSPAAWPHLRSILLGVN